MKKALIVLSFLFITGLLLSSCKTHEKCPAFGKVKTEKTQEQPS